MLLMLSLKLIQKGEEIPQKPYIIVKDLGNSNIVSLSVPSPFTAHVEQIADRTCA